MALDEGPDAGCSLWVDGARERAGAIAEGCAYFLSMPSQKAGLEAQERYVAEGNIEYLVHDDEQGPFGPETDDAEKFDVVIIKVSDVKETLSIILEGVRSILSQKGYVIVLSQHDGGPIEKFNPQGLTTVPGLSTARPLGIEYIGTPTGIEEPEDGASTDNEVHAVHFSTADDVMEAARGLLAKCGWDVISCSHLLSEEIPADSTVLVLDEMFSPVMSTLGDDLRDLIERGCRILWVTMG
jgi:hypothetical protein